MKKILTGCLMAGTAMALPAAAHAKDTWSLELEAEGFYDSQLVVEEVDLEEAQDDFGIKLGADVEFQAIDKKAFELELGYDFGQTLYAEFDEFNLQSHVAHVAAATRLGGAKLGARYAFSHYRLDGDALFDMHSITPSVAGFVADQLYARGYYTYLDKDFSQRDGRDATGHQVGGSLFKFFDGNASYVSLNGRWEQEDAFDPAFDYDGFSIGADARLSLNGERSGPYVQAGVDYRDRDYDAITPSIGEVRTEDRLRGKAAFVYPLNDKLRVETGYRYTDRNSNLPSANYVEHRASAGVAFEL